MLPGVKIFLDIDDLRDVSELEYYVEKSASTQLFLSRGYLQSRNCLREVDATLKKAKPYQFVHEADPEKGGGPLEELKEELDDEEQRKSLFESGHPVTTWHRIAEFQVVSLKLIAEEMLSASQRGQAFSLLVPGSLLQLELDFKTPVVLYASPNNPGAKELAEELKACFSNIEVCQVRRQLADVRQRSLAFAMPSLRLRSCRASLVSLSSPTRNESGEIGVEPTHFLLYLNQKTFVDKVAGKRLADEVQAARAEGMRIKLAHENDGEDEGRAGCAFSRFFRTTPKELILDGLYKEQVATAFMGSEMHRIVSRKLFAQSLGAVVRKKRARWVGLANPGPVQSSAI